MLDLLNSVLMEEASAEYPSLLADEQTHLDALHTLWILQSTTPPESQLAHMSHALDQLQDEIVRAPFMVPLTQEHADELVFEETPYLLSSELEEIVAAELGVLPEDLDS